MKITYLRKCFAVGIILLFLTVGFSPIIHAEKNSYKNKSLQSDHHNSINSHNHSSNEPYFAILSMRGIIKDLEILEEHHYHFNATHVVAKGFMIVFIWGLIPCPFYNKIIYNNEEVYVYLEPCNIFNYEKVTVNYITYYGIGSGYLDYELLK